MNEPFRCSFAADDEPMAGSAATDRAFLLVENPGPWGRKALAESRLPEHVRSGLATAADQAGVRVQLIRRHHRAAPRSGFHVFASYAGPRGPWTETAVLSSPDELLELDLPALGEGRSPGFGQHPEPLVLVCTNGRRDTCCAERGRPLVAALAESHPGLTWETTHLGGHRFAGAMLVLPHGLSYGRVTASEGPIIVDAVLRGDLVLERLRGRTAYDGPVQAAEIDLLSRLGTAAIDALDLVDVDVRGEVTTARFHDRRGTHHHTPGVHEGTAGIHNGTPRIHEVTVTAVTAPAARQSCADTLTKPTTSYLVHRPGSC